MKSTAGPLLKLQKGTNIFYDLKFGILELCRILEKMVHTTFIVDSRGELNRNKKFQNYVGELLFQKYNLR